MTSPRPTPTSSRPVAVLVLGTDAVLHARPISAGRLAEACRRAGYESVVPASWGDELVAAACLEELGEVAPAPAALCACPLARAAVAAAPTDVARLNFASPPVAAARYVRELFGARRVHVTFAGTCPGADHPEIDERITPEALLAAARPHLPPSESGPDSVVHDSERRFRSLPGGAPDARWLADADGYALDAVGELAGPPRARTLYDFAPVAGCACAGASLNAAGALPVRAASARGAVAAGEPPRGDAPVLADGRAALFARADEPALDGDGDGGASRPLVEAAGPAREDASARVDRREVSTLVMPARGTRPRRSDGQARVEGVEPIRPHKSSEPIWDGPRRVPLFPIAGVALLLGVGALIYVNRPRPALPPFAEIEAPRAAVASPPPAAQPVPRPDPAPPTPVAASAGATESPAGVSSAAVVSTPAAGATVRPPAAVAAPVAAPASSATLPNAAGDRPVPTRAATSGRETPTRPPTSGRPSVAARTAPARAAAPPKLPAADAAPAAVPDAAAQQAAELRREIEARRARIDSLARSVDSLRAAERRPRPPR